MTDDTAQDRRADRIAALLIGLPALLELAMILHHPVPARTGGGGAAGQFAAIAAVIEANRSFHAILILLLAVQLGGLALLARRLGLRRPWVALGGVFCGLGAVLLLLATALDGFVTHELISRCMRSTGGCAAGTGDSLALILASVQAFTRLGLAAQCLGFAAFAASLLGARGALRLSGLAGAALALAPLLLLASGAYVDAGRILHILIAHALWGAGAAILLGTGRLERGTAPSD